MALTITTLLSDTTLKGATLVAATIAFDSAYPVGGEPVAASDFGLDSEIFAIFPANGGSDVVSYDRAAGTLTIHTADGTVATGDQSAVERDVLVLGR